ncbi:response regulator transcription factor [Cryobacterium sp. HLT2-28]|uniref:response regulator transcription factor n=1 Tax=Cryobacterium sp. HLT2-28 TaxID=1259146 RepID=UPI00106952C1|nr:response regulator transcription factor [Cryobacterium sp. HLT2-28]TFB97293.1 response regulator transcription factor [Cryobacterium sp. HLT2-28]
MKVLLVDDDEKITAAVGRGLRAEGFIVDVERNGIDGLWRASEGSYDAIVLDIMMPGRNGFLVCADLRAVDNWTPILMLTAKDGDLDEAEALDTGADDYLVKPFSFPVLVARLHALIRRSGSATPPPSRVADLRIDPLYHRVWVGETELTVTSREFDVLHFLVHRAGQVLSKQHILDGVWSDDFDGDPNIVEVYVARLRRKLEHHECHATIETLRGAGYRLAAGTGPRSPEAR